MIQALRRNLMREFLALESAGGILLVVTAVAAIVVVNSPLGTFYDRILQLPVLLGVGTFEINKPLLLWINDGLMAVFFFLVGLEIKREALGGELSSPSAVALPAAAAVGGMAAPALIYSAINQGDALAMQGWAIPAATDIAFALGVLALLGPRVPVALKVFLLSVAIIDDLGAIVIIALFYTAEISPVALVVAAASIVALLVLNRAGVTRVSPYMVVGLVLWASVLKSGVHATLAGVVLALFIPAGEDEDGESPLRRLEHDLHGVVAFVILPVFAFANAGVRIETLSLDAFLEPVPLGVALGLFFGNQVGIFGMAWLMVKSGLARMPSGLNWGHIYGAALLAGIGFTMSLFIAGLAFEPNAPGIGDPRLGIILGSTVSAIVGFAVLRFGPCRQAAAPA